MKNKYLSHETDKNRPLHNVSKSIPKLQFKNVKRSQIKHHFLFFAHEQGTIMIIIFNYSYDVIIIIIIITTYHIVVYWAVGKL